MSRLHPSEFAQRFGAWPSGLRIVVPVLLGALASTGHEDWRSGFFALCVAFTVAFLITPQARRSAGWFGWLLGLGYFAVTLRWLVEPFLVDVARHGWMAPFAIFIMAGGLALFWAAAFWLARWAVGARPTVMILLPITLAAAELARGHVFSGFPWGLVSYTLIGGVGDIWFAWVGPYGATLLVFAVLGMTAYCLHRGWTLIWPGLVGVMFATIGVQFLSATTLPVTDQTVRLIQPNAPQHQKWDRDWMPVFFDRAIEQTAAGAVADVVIWPETSVPALLEYADLWLEQMSLAARGAPVVAGIQRRDAAGYYNSAILIEEPSSVAAITDKAHLVPFGEYIPLAWLLEPIGLGVVVEQVAGFQPGSGGGVMQVEGLGLARILICYEGIFPEDMQHGEARADVLVIMTNDAWFGNNAGPRQHLVQAQARAIEQGLPVIRAANTGISAVIDARGKVIASLALNEAGYLDSRVPGSLPVTVYARIGDWPLVVFLAVAFAACVAGHRRFDVDGGQPQV